MDAPPTPQRPPDSQDDDPEVEPLQELSGPNAELLPRNIRRGCTYTLLFVFIGFLVANATLGFLHARHHGYGMASEENMCKIDGAVQQYILEHDLKTVQRFIDLHGTAVADWDVPNLVGPNGYLRVPPPCPNGGTYYIQDYEANDQLAPVISVNKRGEHVVDFPGYTDGVVGQ